jgi:lipopolysaccharide transport system permease protein
MMLWYQAPLGWGALLAPLIVAVIAASALGVGILLSALTVNYRDFRYVVPFMVQLWMFATPSIYMAPEAAVGPRWRLLLALNPAHGLIAAFRQAMLGGPGVEASELAVSCGVGLVLLMLGCWYFRSVERSFADVI